ncbi:MAG: ATP-dependent DNA helicase RecG [Candidatus Cloacimonadota bacterium]|nr:ATP-dependent DNA helicase RecG [Candidatus Cloacimonadota bacterium]
MDKSLLTEIKYLKGVGDYRASLLAKLDIYTINDLIETFPHSYINRNNKIKIANLKYDEVASVVGKISRIDFQKTRSRKDIIHIILNDGTGSLYCTWFYGKKWIESTFAVGQNIWVSGQIKDYRGEFQITHPEFEIIDDDTATGFWQNRSIIPVFPLTKGITQKVMRNLIVNAFTKYHEQIKETLPKQLLEQRNYEPRYIGLQKIHFPTNLQNIEFLKQRFAYEELFYQQLIYARTKIVRNSKKQGFQFKLNKSYTTKLKEYLPFHLTSAQKKVIREIVEDMTSNKQMFRLLQGDVGSGKTIVTLFAMLLSIENGFQSVLMVPTELLAEQHFASITQIISNQPDIRTTLLKGGNYKGKKQQKIDIKNGKFDIIIGTHSIIQKDIIFKRLGIMVIDEQHRFGVRQRAVLSEKNIHPDILYLSATPIPRSLALTAFGDLEVSVIDELPPTRQPIKTYWRGSKRRSEVYQKIDDEVKKGRQAYIVCPLVEESEKMDLLDATSVHEELSQSYLRNCKVGLIHGKMKTDEKDQIMVEFNKGSIDVLVATTVIEVGIDVPNATIMTIEHSERFGLSQLHQLRGRVGRGKYKSYCFLISYPQISNNGRKRLQVMINTNDGFKISEADLEIRGPGELFGTAQSGMPDYRHANIVRDRELLQQARNDAMKIVKEDFDFKNQDNIREKYFSQFRDKEKLFYS